MHDLTLSMRAVMTARRMGKKFAKRIGGYVDYDLHLYEAIESLRQWSSEDTQATKKPLSRPRKSS